jgi:hypothetical protein
MTDKGINATNSRLRAFNRAAEILFQAFAMRPFQEALGQRSRPTCS